MRRNPEKAQDYAARHGVPKWYSNAFDLIQDPEVNAIYIATPPHVHLELTQLAAAAGKPVYVEKPMARTYAECLQMIQTCEQAEVPCLSPITEESSLILLKSRSSWKWVKLGR